MSRKALEKLKEMQTFVGGRVTVMSVSGAMVAKRMRCDLPERSIGSFNFIFLVSCGRDTLYFVLKSEITGVD